MPKEIKEQPLPDFIVDFIGSFIGSKVSLLSLSNINSSKKILNYSYISEQFCLFLQKKMIEEHQSGNPTPITLNPIPNFVIEIKKNVLFLYSQKFKINDIDEISKFLDDFVYSFIEMLINRNKG